MAVKSTERYLAEIFKAMGEFQNTTFTSTEQQDAALSKLLNLRTEMMEEMDREGHTTPAYWECDCEDKYLHVKFKEEECSECRCEHEDSSDAYISDVVRNYMSGGYLA